MAGNLSSQDDEIISGINVTPLVDVVLVLLVIFLITAPVIYQSAIKVQLPAAATGENTDQQSPLNFTVSKDGWVYWGAEKMSWMNLEERLKKMGNETQNQTALISADKITPHGSVIKLMDLLRSVGLTRFALNVDSSQ